MAGRSNMLVRLLARLLRPVVEEALRQREADEGSLLKKAMHTLSRLGYGGQTVYVPLQRRR